MFTGIIEAALRVASVEDAGGLRRITLDLSSVKDAVSVRLGDSIALNGCCLTVAKLDHSAATFEAVPQTLGLTNLGDLKPGSIVNVERALVAGARLDGHLVQGHVDATGKIAAVDHVGGERRLTVVCETAFARQCVSKGSVCVDGISLTIAELGDDRFTVAIIPHTWEVTNLHTRKAGDRVNLEADVIGKYVLAHLQRMTTRPSNVSEDLLKRAGFL